MPLKNDNYDLIIRTEEENEKFLKLLEEAKDKLEQAVDGIIYSNFGNLNNSIETELKNMIQNINQIKRDVSSGYEPLYKPVKR